MALNQQVVWNTGPLSQSPLRKNKSSVQGNGEPVDYLGNKRKREKEDNGRQKERQKGYLALMIMKLKSGGLSSSTCLVFLDLRIVTPWCVTA